MRFRKWCGGTAVALTAVLGSGVAQAEAGTPGDTLAAGLQKLTGTDGVIGAIGMVRDGETTQYAAAGTGDYFAGTPADPHTKFRIGSNTKAFTSVVLLQLEAEGKLSLDDTVDRWLPGLVDSNGNDGTNITVRQLLNHTSGLPEYATGRLMLDYGGNLNPSEPHPPEQLVAAAVADKPTSAPGAAYHYSNTNYVLAGMVIKAVTGNDPATEIGTRIIAPLGLSDTTFPTSDPAMPADHLSGHFHVHGPVFLIRDVTASNVRFFGAAGAIVSTVDDLADFERALFSGELLPPAQQQELQTTVPMSDDPAAGGYGLGVGLVRTECGPVWTHTGEVLGYASTWLTSPDGRRQVVVANNEHNLVQDPVISKDLWEQPLAAYCATGGS
ncbi:serine hydrolase domain-containing protein [Amycolatopsis jiangsuensis]|uniref:D-alanyl-D-alanine carboxypeptidase n=1 Tax=Amycolatopsis jiangsuensis TaxID=1181879 RepID=A0A840IQ97_9PSEU|nr:serine hydrolase domain-containing protein [Amycolatopsis jiangsuensis]MBB4684080.1 D-alanyl-D-alanine carboxypeptidase [Amycolatopsis jiangsuensis]